MPIDYEFKKTLARELTAILRDENRFESVEFAMPDMITCYFHGSKYLPKNIQHKSPLIQCSFTFYPKKLVFSIEYFKGKGCENIIKRINEELPDLKEPVNTNSEKLSILTLLDVINEKELEYLSKTSNINLRMNILKEKIDSFFEIKANKIISKIIEILVGIRV